MLDNIRLAAAEKLPEGWQAALGALAVSLAATVASAQFPGQKTYCNSIDIDYKYTSTRCSHKFPARRDRGIPPSFTTRIRIAGSCIQNYSFAIESFNESGVSKVSRAVKTE